MDWIQGLQRAIDYVEENITEELDFENVASQAYSSSFHFQRVFAIMCGFTLGDYIRMRRLSLAGEELSKGNAKIIDIALKYGYDTPETGAKKAAQYARVQELAHRFAGKNGSIVCRELLGLRKKEDPPTPEARTAEYYAKRPCKALIGAAAELLENYIREHPV